MSLLADGMASSSIDQLIPVRDRIPDDPEPGAYVVVDVAQFSTTVPELFANGAEYIHITEQRGNEPAFKEDHPRAKIGGDAGPDYEGMAGYDFFNSPSVVNEIDVSGRPTAMTSTNGGNAVTDLRLNGGDNVTVYVGGLTNGRAVADHLRTVDEPIYFVAAGSAGTPSPEDVAGAQFIAHHLRDEPPTDREQAIYRELVALSKGPKYEEKPPVKRTDLYEYTLAVDSRDVVPKLDGQKLYDVAGES